MSKNITDNLYYSMIVLILSGIAIMGLLVCDKEFFGNVTKKVNSIAKNTVGYPRPQGNLPNFKFGLTKETQDKMTKQWNAVLSKMKMEKFVIPRSNTVI